MKFISQNILAMAFVGVFTFGHISASFAVEDLLMGGKDNPKLEVIGAIAGLTVNIPAHFKLEFPVEKFVLPNGMTFLLHENHQIPMISYQTWFRVGSKDELKGESGLAHMLEHMMFKGSKKYTNKEFDRILHENGINNNAFTTNDYTGYYENLPSQKLELIMDIEVDRLMSLVLQAPDLEKEREVVKEERRMRTDNDPQGQGWEKLFSMVFPENNYGVPVIGTMKEINEYNIDKLKKFLGKWYLPSNAVVVLVGDFDSDQVRKLIKKYYGDLPATPAPAPQPMPFEEQKTSRFAKVEFPVNSINMMWGYKTVPSGDADAYALDILGAVLGHGKSSRLHQRFVYKEQLCLASFAGHDSMKESSMFYIGLVLKPGQSPERLRNSVNEEVKKIAEQGIREEELQKVKNLIISDYVNNLQTLDGKARILALNEILYRDYTQFFKDLDKYRQVTSADVKAVAQHYLKESRQNLVVVETPSKKAKGVLK